MEVLPPPPPLPLTDAPYEQRGTINVINEDFVLCGGTRCAKEVYAANTSAGVTLGKIPRLVERDAITFLDKDLEHVAIPHEDALIIMAEIDGFDVKIILVELGSFTDILFLEAFLAMGKLKKGLKKVDFHLIGFAGRINLSRGAIKLHVIMGEEMKALRREITFIVVDAPNSYKSSWGS